jgi:hypothetical protein
MELFKDYHILPPKPEDGDALIVGIVSGKFRDTIFTVSNFKFGSTNDIHFDMQVIHPEKGYEGKDKQKFHKIVNYVVANMMSRMYEYAKSNPLEEDDGNGNADYIELDTERAVRNEDAPVHENRVPERKSRKGSVRRNRKVPQKVQ